MKGRMKLVPVAIRINPEMRDKLQKIADKEMRSLSNLSKKILTEYLQDYEKNPAKPSK